MSPTTDLEPGAVFDGRYRIVCQIGAGGMGAVYEAVQLKTDRPRALKVMHASTLGNEQLRARFAREAKIIAGVESDHIVEIIDAGVEERTRTPYIVMELLKGESLSGAIAREGRLAPETVITYLAQAAHALDKAHVAGVVHRDLKPENLFITWADDGRPRVKVLDFGIAKALHDSSGALTQGILGTPLYISPEQIHSGSQVTGRTDHYALAHIAYHCLVGEAYFSVEAEEVASLIEMMYAVHRGPTEPAVARAARRRAVALPTAFDAWFATATNPVVERRYATARELVQALSKALGGWSADRQSSQREERPAVAKTVAAAPEELPPTALLTASAVAHSVVVVPTRARWPIVLALGLFAAGAVSLWLFTREPVPIRVEVASAAPIEAPPSAAAEPDDEPGATPVEPDASASASAVSSSSAAPAPHPPRSTPRTPSSGFRPPLTER